jgi:hypothetical protein
MSNDYRQKAGLKMAIEETDLTHAIAKWSEGIIAISATYEEKGIERATVIASEMLDKLYGFEFGPILFKPTLSGGEQTFRTTKQGALSYFVGHNPDYPSDIGFGIKFWREVKSQTSAIMIDQTVAMWMGWVMFTDKKGNTVKVDKSFAFKRAETGDLKIVMHHSSLPYEA